MLIKGPKEFPAGANKITDRADVNQKTMMDFEIIVLKPGENYTNELPLERAFLLVEGNLNINYKGDTFSLNRDSCFDSPPWVIHLPKNEKVSIEAAKKSEIAYIATENSNEFQARLYSPAECASENRGVGTMRETSTRIVRTVFDYSNAPHSKLVLGEVIGFPGKWSSYPPHHHPQPEIYFYKFLPENGYGFSQLDDKAVMTEHNSTVLIVNCETHPQVTAPGYAMWYLWVIRHLDDEPYISPIFLEEHLWVTEPEADIWPKE